MPICSQTERFSLLLYMAQQDSCQILRSYYLPLSDCRFLGNAIIVHNVNPAQFQPPSPHNALHTTVAICWLVCSLKSRTPEGRDQVCVTQAYLSPIWGMWKFLSKYLWNPELQSLKNSLCFKSLF